MENEVQEVMTNVVTEVAETAPAVVENVAKKAGSLTKSSVGWMAVGAGAATLVVGAVVGGKKLFKKITTKIAEKKAAKTAAPAEAPADATGENPAPVETENNN